LRRAETFIGTLKRVSHHYLKVAPYGHRKEEEKLEETKQKEEKFLSEAEEENVALSIRFSNR
jgi:hypothetical protein